MQSQPGVTSVVCSEEWIGTVAGNTLKIFSDYDLKRSGQCEFEIVFQDNIYIANFMVSKNLAVAAFRDGRIEVWSLYDLKQMYIKMKNGIFPTSVFIGSDGCTLVVGNCGDPALPLGFEHVFDIWNFLEWRVDCQSQVWFSGRSKTLT